MVEADDLGIYHLRVQVIPFAGPFTNASEQGNPGMGLSDVIDKFHNEDRLPNTGATKQANLPTTLRYGPTSRWL